MHQFNKIIFLLKGVVACSGTCSFAKYVSKLCISFLFCHGYKPMLYKFTITLTCVCLPPMVQIKNLSRDLQHNCLLFRWLPKANFSSNCKFLFSLRLMKNYLSNPFAISIIIISQFYSNKNTIQQRNIR